jgi:serine/threonine protein phosphatase PrpC
MKFADLDTNYAVSAVKGKGHDRHFIRPDFVGIADGATPLDPSWPSNPGEFAAFALAELARASRQEHADIVTVWRQAISRAANEFSVVEPQLSCSLAIARRTGDVIELACLGDCGAIILCRDGSLMSIRDDVISEFDSEADGASGEEVQRILLRNRASLNTLGGYWAFSANTDAADHILTSRIRVDELENLVLYTDGFYRLRDYYKILQSDEELLQLVLEIGPPAAIDWLRQYENSLPGGTPRPADDAAIIVASRNQS